MDGTPVFGRHSEGATDDVFILGEAFFLAGDESADANTLRPFGMEIHRPAQLLVVPWLSVLYEEPLTPAAPAVLAITEYRSDNPTDTVAAPDFQTGAYAAVFLRNGSVFFGFLTLDNQTARLSDAHFLRFRDPGAADTREITSLDQVELIPEAEAAAGSTGEMVIPLTSILYMQPLAADSPVISALSARGEATP